MKKLMMAAVAAVAMTAGAAPLNPKTCTEQEIRAVLSMVQSCENTDDATRVAASNKVMNALSQNRFSSLRAEADDILGAKGVCALWTDCATWPKVSANDRIRNGADKAYAKSIVIAQHLGANLTGSSILHKGGTIDDVSVWLSEAVAFPENCTVGLHTFGDAISWIQRSAVIRIKTYLRSQGKSFVTKNGINPCEKYIIALNTALNAPRFAGLDAWLKSVGCKGVDLSKLPSEEEVAKLKEDILYGRREMTSRNESILYICLGIEGYNAFVKEYNGEQ